MDAILVISAAVVNFFISSVWYGAFGNIWIKAWCLKKEEVEARDPKPYLISFIGSLWASYGLFLLIKHVKPQSLIELLALAIATWVFIIVGLGAKHYAFAQVSIKAFIIGHTVDLVGVLVMCLMLSDL